MALHHLAPREKIDLHSGNAATGERTSALVKTDRFEALKLILAAGEDIAAHAVPGYATIQCFQGSVIIDADTPVQMNAGDWLYLERGERHSVKALEPSALLVTVLFD